MLSKKDIREYISSLGIATDENVYIGKMDSKKQKAIGVYSRKTDGSPQIALGGLDATTYAVKPISLLVHWTKSTDETERVAYKLFETLQKETSLAIGDTQVHFIRMQVPEPQDVGTDDDGVYEYVIWLDFVYERSNKNG